MKPQELGQLMQLLGRIGTELAFIREPLIGILHTLESRPPSHSAERIVDAILEDLSDRRGLGKEWDQIDGELQGEIREAWIEIVRGPRDGS